MHSKGDSNANSTCALSNKVSKCVFKSVSEIFSLPVRRLYSNWTTWKAKKDAGVDPAAPMMVTELLWGAGWRRDACVTTIRTEVARTRRVCHFSDHTITTTESDKNVMFQFLSSFSFNYVIVVLCFDVERNDSKIEDNNQHVGKIMCDEKIKRRPDLPINKICPYTAFITFLVALTQSFFPLPSSRERAWWWGRWVYRERVGLASSLPLPDSCWDSSHFHQFYNVVSF